MTLKVLFLFAMLQLVYSANQTYNCKERSALLLLKRPAYNFSTRILDRVAQNENAHFVFSPLSTWLQLSTLAEGATGITLRELSEVTRQHRNRCFKMKLARILQKIYKRLKREFKRNSVIVIDDTSAVKKNYIRNVQKFYGVKVLLKRFSYPEISAAEVNRFIKSGTNGIITEALSSYDFNNTVMLMSDNVYFRSAWQIPFNPAYTKTEDFWSSSGNSIGEVNMMNQIGYFNMIKLPLNIKVLEIPCNNGISMLLFLPIKDIWVGDIFYDLQKTTLNSIFNAFKYQGPKLVNVRIPRFKVTTSIDNLPELIYDMGVRRVFNPKKSELNNISDYIMYASLITQIADIEVTEQGVTGTVRAETLVNETVNDTEEFVANRPFAFIIVDKKSQFIIFAGEYSEPSVI
ncbi:Serpin-14 [Operophtera brumata]|uniref:Serpin-14 n=1 Tax=Operophtera brumata TaxID=104452 RepID=A0A0L7LTX4_OPEBR|nr:Serpin-14 [Operophtera brumata]